MSNGDKYGCIHETDILQQVTNVADPEFRCYELDLQNTPGETQTATVSAGSVIGFKGTYLIMRLWANIDAFHLQR